MIAAVRTVTLAFMLPAGVPLYPPTVIYQQLIGETKSRINACKGYQAAHHEWVATLGDDGNNFTHKHWCVLCSGQCMVLRLLLHRTL